MDADGEYQKGGLGIIKKDDVELLSRDQELVFGRDDSKTPQLKTELETI